ncbi:hypothetical protein L6E12_34015 [Actinokineospora sp. PR83]|uniref:hypothetical protein n=1 Tax=Actinokineospora sp. PR83 TaxID=2884908 RepID=UPI001F2E3FBC|nr:hypothetical protein [Actinokineospora sp. PR83]MCG8920784.1 hypothetical protein [Actinokineospora sp. PR83]
MVGGATRRLLVSRAAVRRRHAVLLRELPVPVPFDAGALCARVAERRGRPIRLVPMAGLTGVCGMWVATDTADLVFHESDTTPPHRDHIILHELAHLLCDHRISIPLAEQARALLPDLDPDVVRRVLGRTAHSGPEEREAEHLAYLIRHRGAPGTTLTTRLHRALGGDDLV